MESTQINLIEETPNLIEHYRPLRLKAVVAATAVKRGVQEDKPSGEGRSSVGLTGGELDMPFSD